MSLKGLAAVLGGAAKGPAAKLGPKPPMPTEPVEEEEKPETDASSETELAKLAVEAIASGDTEAGASALVSAIKACMSSYGAK